MKTMTLKGCGTALVTPFTESGEVDYLAYAEMVKRQVKGGVDFLVPLGTTAETPCLEDEEKIELLKITKQYAQGKPIIVGAGSNSLRHTIKNIQLLEPYGPDGYLVVVPYYNKPVQEGMYQYFKAVAESTEKSIVLYNVPGRTGSNMLPRTTLRLAEIPNIVAIKEASGKTDQIFDIVKHAPEGFTVLSGNDDQTFELMRDGVAGLISVASNIDPEKVSELVHTMAAGDYEMGAKQSAFLMPLFKNCFVESNPIPVKGGLSLMGLCRNDCRLPLTPATKETLQIMDKTIRDLNK